ncbi:MAG TPA: hypothetical protein PLL00_13765 [Bacteroidia bacterium]|jgi:hypothetical protein|nr:hypothetical protein [Bacteroidia bacterium]
MKKNFLLAIGSLFSIVAIAQNPYLENKYSWKLSNLSTLTTNNKYQLLHPTIAFDWLSKRKNTHELELIDLALNRGNIREYSMSGNKRFTEGTRQTAISMRYEYKINFNTKRESRWIPSLGFSVNPYYQEYSFVFNDSLPQRIESKAAGIRLGFNPSITYFVTKKLYLTSSLSFTIADISGTRFRSSGPGAQPEQYNREPHINFMNIKDKFEFRVGVGYRF